eukprot:7874305-Ditylum_brightwellii.AAC.2
MVEVQDLLQHLKDDKEGKKETLHVVILLLEEFKGERGENWHLVLLADVTSSGLKPRLWTEQVARMLHAEERMSDVAICDCE